MLLSLTVHGAACLLCRFAGYQQEDGGKVVGDPAETGFTKMLQEEFGWKPPCNPGRFDVLPLVLQAHPDERPQVCICAPCRLT